MNPPGNPKHIEQIPRELKKADSVELPMDPAYYDQLHSRIMGAIAETQIEPKSRLEGPKNYLRSHFKSWLQIMGAFAVLSLMSGEINPLWSGFFESSHTFQSSKNERLLLHELTLDSQALSLGLVMHQSESEFLVDLAEHSFHDLSKQDFHALVGDGG